MSVHPLINPKLPEHFFDLDNGLRSPSELNEFWNVPIILTDDYQENDTWEDYQERTTGFEGKFVLKTESDFNAWLLDKKHSWFKAFPTGTAYRVYCLDGGAWDRPTSWGSFGSLDEAKACCENGPKWRRLNNQQGGVITDSSLWFFEEADIDESKFAGIYYLDSYIGGIYG